MLGSIHNPHTKQYPISSNRYFAYIHVPCSRSCGLCLVSVPPPERGRAPRLRATLPTWWPSPASSRWCSRCVWGWASTLRSQSVCVDKEWVQGKDSQHVWGSFELTSNFILISSKLHTEYMHNLFHGQAGTQLCMSSCMSIVSCLHASYSNVKFCERSTITLVQNAVKMGLHIAHNMASTNRVFFIRGEINSNTATNISRHRTLVWFTELISTITQCSTLFPGPWHSVQLYILMKPQIVSGQV